MSNSFFCDHCKNEIPPSADRCPHCGLSVSSPNVRAAENPGERHALARRYRSARKALLARNAVTVLNDFEAAVATSKAIIARSENELQQLATSDNELYATYYQLIGGGIKIPVGSNWDTLRAVTDSALFPNYKEHIRFAALSLDGMGLFNYGNCSIVLRDNMIAHRASVFEENSVLFMKHCHIKMWDAPKLPRGYRATWKERAKLCVAKLHDRINATTQAHEYPALLLQQGATSGDDEFVEVHIYGSMTRRAIEQVILSPRLKRAQRATILKALKEKLARIGVIIS
jgi:hypothetical protein